MHAHITPRDLFTLLILLPRRPLGNRGELDLRVWTMRQARVSKSWLFAGVRIIYLHPAFPVKGCNNPFRHAGSVNFSAPSPTTSAHVCPMPTIVCIAMREVAMVPSKCRGHFSNSGHTCKQPSTPRPLLPNMVVSQDFVLIQT